MKSILFKYSRNNAIGKRLFVLTQNDRSIICTCVPIKLSWNVVKVILSKTGLRQHRIDFQATIFASMAVMLMCITWYQYHHYACLLSLKLNYQLLNYWN